MEYFAGISNKTAYSIGWRLFITYFLPCIVFFGSMVWIWRHV
jgi:hypothetical protein